MHKKLTFEREIICLSVLLLHQTSNFSTFHVQYFLHAKSKEKISHDVIEVSI